MGDETVDTAGLDALSSESLAVPPRPNRCVPTRGMRPPPGYPCPLLHIHVQIRPYSEASSAGPQAAPNRGSIARTRVGVFSLVKGLEDLSDLTGRSGRHLLLRKM